MYGALWSGSLMAMEEAEFARLSMVERHVQDGTLRIRPGGLPEEVMTWKLVRLLSGLHSGPTSTLIIATHSKGLEGGTTNQLASGADLELAIEVAPGEWIDLVLQAKRLYTDSASYDSWKQSQIEALQTWAGLNDRIPGMLLYNAQVAPFIDGSVVSQGACSIEAVKMSLAAAPPTPFPTPCAPLGVTLVVLPTTPKVVPIGLEGDGLAAAVVNDYASPWECVLCSHWPARSTHSAGGLPEVPILDAMPSWATEIAALLMGQEDQGRIVRLEDVPRPEGSPRLSVVVPWSGDDRPA
jgi:hypothetical protein